MEAQHLHKPANPNLSLKEGTAVFWRGGKGSGSLGHSVNLALTTAELGQNRATRFRFFGHQKSFG
jgi:hypothetical protein